MYLHFALLQSWKIKHFFTGGKKNYIYTLRTKEIKGKLTSLSICRRFSGEKVCVWLFVLSFRGSTRLLESQLTEPPCRGSQRAFLAPLGRNPSSRTADKLKNTHIRVQSGHVQKLITTLGGHGQSDGQVQEADREGPC